MTNNLILALPSKGRLMDQTTEALGRAGLVVRKVGNGRGYRGEVVGRPDIDVIFVSASEIAQQLKAGAVHLGVTGEDLVREDILNADDRVELVAKLGFGHADVVVAVPNCWLDVASMADLAEMARGFRRLHGRRPRVATKYMNLTRGFFRDRGVADYRLVESLGATEGTPAAGTADLVVDITSTGATLKDNGLKILSDGVILRSEANLVVAKAARVSAATKAVRDGVVALVRSSVDKHA